MKIPRPNLPLILTIVAAVFTSCGEELRTSKDLSREDKRFIQRLGILDDGEEIILCASQGGGFEPLKTAGNFFTDKRIAAYWIDNRDSAETIIEYAFYTDVDTIRTYPRYKSLTYASYLEVHRKDGTKFKVYVSADSAKTWHFFNRALQEWKKKVYPNKASISLFSTEPMTMEFLPSK